MTKYPEFAYTGKMPEKGYVGFVNIQKTDTGVQFMVRSQGENPTLATFAALGSKHTKGGAPTADTAGGYHRIWDEIRKRCCWPGFPVMIAQWRRAKERQQEHLAPAAWA